MSTKPAPPQPVTPLSETPLEAASEDDNSYAAIRDSRLSHGKSPTLDAIVAPPHISNTGKLSTPNASTAHKYPSEPYLHLVDKFLINRLTAHRIDLNKIDIAILGLSVGTVNSLKRANITTLAQLSDCSKTDLLSVRSIGITRVLQIQEDLNFFLNSLLAGIKGEPVKQLSFGLATEQQEHTVQEDPRRQLAELTGRLCDIFQRKISLSPALLPPLVWKDLCSVLGKEPKSFSELMHLVHELKLNDDNDIDADSTGRCLALKRATQWLKRAVEYGCLDEEIHHIVNSLNERERLILSGRYKIDRPLTLEALGGQLGITRERVRQIQQKVQKKLIARIKRATLLYSTTALHILRSQKDNVTLTTWTKQLVATGLLKDQRS